MAYQFIHLETYGRRAKDHRTTAFILAEARRNPPDCLHVDHPQAPVIVHGLGVEEVERVHDDLAASARTTTAAGRERAIRQDQHTLLGVVLSHPTPWDVARCDKTAMEEVLAWQERSVSWLQAQFEERLRCVVRHDDERFPHLHAFIIPDDPELRAKALHPGAAAKAAAIATARAEGANPKAANRIGDQAYCDAMRTWQDDYWQNVGLPSGLARLGPGRRRLTRGEWQAEQAAVRSVATATSAASAVAAELARQQARVEAVRAEGHLVVDRAQKRLAAAKAAEQRARLAALQAHDVERQMEARLREIESQAQRQRSFGARLGFVLAGLVGFRAILEARHRHVVEAARREAVEQITEVSAKARAAVRRLEREAKRARADAERERQAADAARQEVRLARLQIQRTAVERDRARSAYANAAVELDALRCGRPGQPSI